MMNTDTLIDQIRATAEPIVTAAGAELVELSFKRAHHDVILRLLIDQQGGGIALDQCAAVNRRIGTALEAQGIVREAYQLEVASPGLDRPLVTQRDFARAHGALVRVQCRNAIKGQSDFTGVVQTTNTGSWYWPRAPMAT